MVDLPPKFMVVLAHNEKPDPMALAKILASARKTPVQDQMITARNSWGIVGENLGEVEAQKLVSQFRDGGLDTAALPVSAFIPSPETALATTIQTAMSGELVLAAVASLTLTSTSTKTVKEGPSTGQKILSAAILMGTGLPVRIGGKTRQVEVVQQHSDHLFYLDLFSGNPLRRLRVDANKFDYSFLEKRKLYQVLGNFKLLVGELLKKAPNAWRNHGARVLLEGKPMQTMGYQALADLERESRWLLTLQSLKR